MSTSHKTINIIMPGSMFCEIFRDGTEEFNLMLKTLSWAKGNCIHRNKTMLLVTLMIQHHDTIESDLSKTEKSH